MPGWLPWPRLPDVPLILWQGQIIPSAFPQVLWTHAETRGYMLWDLRKRCPTHLGGSRGNIGPRNLCVSPPLSRKAESVSRVLCLYCIYCIYFLKINKKIIKKESIFKWCTLLSICRKNLAKLNILKTHHARFKHGSAAWETDDALTTRPYHIIKINWKMCCI